MDKKNKKHNEKRTLESRRPEMPTTSTPVKSRRSPVSSEIRTRAGPERSVGNPSPVDGEEDMFSRIKINKRSAAATPSSSHSAKKESKEKAKESVIKANPRASSSASGTFSKGPKTSTAEISPNQSKRKRRLFCSGSAGSNLDAASPAKKAKNAPLSKSSSSTSICSRGATRRVGRPKNIVDEKEAESSSCPPHNQAPPLKRGRDSPKKKPTAVLISSTSKEKKGPARSTAIIVPPNEAKNSKRVSIRTRKYSPAPAKSSAKKFRKNSLKLKQIKSAEEQNSEESPVAAQNEKEKMPEEFPEIEKDEVPVSQPSYSVTDPPAEQETDKEAYDQQISPSVEISSEISHDDNQGISLDKKDDDDGDCVIEASSKEEKEPERAALQEEGDAVKAAEAIEEDHRAEEVKSCVVNLLDLLDAQEMKISTQTNGNLDILNGEVANCIPDDSTESSLSSLSSESSSSQAVQFLEGLIAQDDPASYEETSPDEMILVILMREMALRDADDYSPKFNEKVEEASPFFDPDVSSPHLVNFIEDFHLSTYFLKEEVVLDEDESASASNSSTPSLGQNNEDVEETNGEIEDKQTAGSSSPGTSSNEEDNEDEFASTSNSPTASPGQNTEDEETSESPGEDRDDSSSAGTISDEDDDKDNSVSSPPPRPQLTKEWLKWRLKKWKWLAKKKKVEREKRKGAENVKMLEEKEKAYAKEKERRHVAYVKRKTDRARRLLEEREAEKLVKRPRLPPGPSIPLKVGKPASLPCWTEEDLAQRMGGCSAPRQPEANIHRPVGFFPGHQFPMMRSPCPPSSVLPGSPARIQMRSPQLFQSPLALLAFAQNPAPALHGRTSTLVTRKLGPQLIAETMKNMEADKFKQTGQRTVDTGRRSQPIQKNEHPVPAQEAHRGLVPAQEAPPSSSAPSYYPATVFPYQDPSQVIFLD